MSGLAVGTELMGQVTVVSFAGELDLSTMDQFATALQMHLSDGAPIVDIDMADVAFVSAAGARVLLDAVDHARRRGVTVHITPSDALGRTVALFDAIIEAHVDPNSPAT